MKFKQAKILGVLVLIFVLIFSISACDMMNDIEEVVEETEEDLNPDIPEDPDTDPPPSVEGELSPTFSAEVKDPEKNRIALNLSGLLHPESLEPIEYSQDNLTVVESGQVKGIKISLLDTETVRASSELKVDIVFIIDTTGSMEPYINGVKTSVLEFMEHIEEAGFNINAGALAYADCINPEDNPAGIPEDEKAAWAVVDYSSLGSDLSEIGDTYNFVEGLHASYKGYHGSDYPEGLFDSIWWAYENYEFRLGAQKMFIVLTDAPSWGEGHNSYEVHSDTPWTDANLAEELRGEVITHVVSTAIDTEELEYYDGSYDPKYLAESGGPNDSSGTGGIWFEMETGDEIDLTEIPIAKQAGASALVEYESADIYEEHEVRVILVEDEEAKGEVKKTIRYIE